MKTYQNKVFLEITDLQNAIKAWKAQQQKVVFTNGCFDILHRGHVHSLTEAAKCGDKLIIGLNADNSVKKLKGKSRPILSEKDRATVLAAFEMVDAVIIFNEETPQKLIEQLLPDVLVKGKDYTVDDIAGADVVLQHGGTVKTIRLIDGISTSEIIKKIQQAK